MQQLTIGDLRTTHTQVEPATEKQINFLRTLIAERTPDVDEDYIEAVIAQGKDRVSQAIKRLLATKPVPQADRPRRNLYAGRCGKCGIEVPAQEGLLRRDNYGNWEPIHEGDCPDPNDANQFPFPFGRYAVETDEGHLAFYVANAWGLYVQASDELHPVAHYARQRIIDKIATDPEAASIRYGLEIGACGRCGRTLTNDESRERGIGPECAKKGWD